MQQNLRLNPHGLAGILFVILMFGIAFSLGWNINWWYFVLAIMLYSGAVLLLTGAEESAIKGIATNPSNTDKTLLLMIARVLFGCHAALLFLAVGLLIRFQSNDLIANSPVRSSYFIVGITRSGYFIASIIGGLALPFLLLKKFQDKNRISLYGIIATILIILLFLIALLYNWNISWWYFMLAITLFTGATIFLNLREDFPPTNGPAPKLFRPRLGWNLAFIFLMVGFGLHFHDEGANFGFFIASIAGGLVIPYLLFRGS
jgi:hypothetical protein